MISYRQYINESKEDKNVHLEHVEDLILTRGVSGARDSLNFLGSLRNMLAGHASRQTLNLSSKWDGCLDKNTQIITNEGIKTLEEIYNSWHSNKEIFVLSFDEENQIDCFVPILASSATKSIKNWVEIDLGASKIIATEDHEIMTTNRGWCPAGELTEDDDIKISENINIDGNHLCLGELRFEIRLENKIILD